MPVAIDIVLLPLPEIQRLCYSLSKQISPQIPLLNENNAVPHITLAMGAVAEENLGSIIQSLPYQQLPIKLQSEGLYSQNFGQNQQVIGWQFRLDSQLMSLHQASLKVLKPYLTTDFDYSALANVENPQPTAEEYIRSFSSKSSGKNFHPHITLGFGEMPAQNYLPTQTTIVELALFRLGKFCTCAERISV